jgi:hypothetical protein
MLAAVRVKLWDAFISHASEDTEVVVLLAEALRRAGLRIWLDQQELRLGDSLSEKIDEGLAASRFGIVVLSPSFLAKRWPRRELNGLVALEDDGRKVILPVWHQLDRETLVGYSPILADRLAADTRDGVARVAAEIVRVIVDPESGSPAVESPTLARRFIELLDSAVEPGAVRDFLAAHPQIAGRAAGGELAACGVQLDRFSVDLCIVGITGTTGAATWSLVVLDSPAQHPFPGGPEPADSVRKHVADLEALRRWLPANLPVARSQLPDVSSSFRGVVVAGRRSLLSTDDLEHVRRYNEELFGLTLRTYDWLVDAAATLS